MILSRNQIEAIGTAVIHDFEQQCGPLSDYANDMARNAFPIERFAAEYLGLEVSMTLLSTDGSICGLTAYTDTNYRVPGDGSTRSIPLHRKQVLLDSSLAGAFHTGRRRFTLSHECAHQILFSLEDEAIRREKQMTYSKRASYSLRELKTREDWNEWQANALAAAILIPIDKLKDARYRLAQIRPVKCYGKKLDPNGHADVEALCGLFLISKSAMLIRLRQIGAVVDRPESEYRRDPLEVWP